MKIFLCVFFSAALACSADPSRYEWRTVGGNNLDMLPLFNWWHYASAQSQIPKVDISALDTNQIVPAVSNIWQKLPPKPLAGWCRIQAEKITVAGNYWLVDAEIDLAPQIKRRAQIYLAHPPTKEIQNFNAAKAELLDLISKRESAREEVASIAADQNRYSSEGSRLGMLREAFPYNEVIAGYAQDNAGWQRSLDKWGKQATTDVQSIQGRLTILQKFLDGFPSNSEYALDHFAFRTGKTVNGLDVYDLALAQGLNY